jgi:GH25 family lysozyme M1 (1,4-beta-N-acetylmuramidase)
VDWLLTNTECQIAVYGASFLFDTVRDQYAPELAATSLWAARYSSQEPEIALWPRWDLWQYTDKAECKGVSTPVDGNKWNDDSGNLDDWFFDPMFALRRPVPVIDITVSSDTKCIIRVNGIAVST